MCKIKRKHPEEVPEESVPMAGMGGHPVIRNIVVEVAADRELEIEPLEVQTRREAPCVFTDRQTQSAHFGSQAKTDGYLHYPSSCWNLLSFLKN